MNNLEFVQRKISHIKPEVTTLTSEQSNLGCCEIIGPSLTDILIDPFVERLKADGKWHVWTDFDGVFTNPWNEQETLEDLKAFQRVVELSEELTVATSKTFIDHTSPFYRIITASGVRKSPLGFFVYSRDKFDRFLDLAHKKNPLCKIKILSGIHKLFSQQDWHAQFEVIKDSLAAGNTTIVMGSSILDKRRMFDLVNWLEKSEVVDLQNLFYFNTKHIFV